MLEYTTDTKKICSHIKRVMTVFFSWHSRENLTVRKFKENKMREQLEIGNVFFLSIIPFSLLS
jgi:hypothetical protein